MTGPIAEPNNLRRHPSPPSSPVGWGHCSIVPPHMLEHLARHGNAEQRGAALSTLQRDASFRARRFALLEATRGLLPGAPRFRRMWAVGQCVPNRSIYDAQGSENLPGTRAMGEGDPPSGDVAVQEAYDGFGSTHDLYCSAYQRNSIDGRGMAMVGTVHYGQEYDNAFWNGSQMIFGDGDGQIFNRFTISVDVIGHELTHGVTQHEAALVYWAQAGALNESISDVFGSLVKQHTLDQTADQADWLIGQGLLTAAVQGVALRSMKAPGTAYDDPNLGKDPQPADMSGYVSTMSDNGGVHINSGIPNHAFYLAATRIGGNAWETAGVIWYRALLSPWLRPRSGFRRMALVTAGVARSLYGANSAEAGAVVSAWSEVGIDVSSLRARRVLAAGGAARAVRVQARAPGAGAARPVRAARKASTRAAGSGRSGRSGGAVPRGGRSGTTRSRRSPRTAR